METYELTHRADLYISDCPACGIVFGIPSAMEERRRRDGKSFYCPNGHTMSWSETEADRERKAREEAEARATALRSRLDQARAEADHQHRRAVAYKGVATKAKRRAVKGMCPVPGCRRNFANVARHVANQHPDYQPSDHHEAHDGVPT